MATLQVHCRYTATTLYIHCRYTAFGSVLHSAVYTVVSHDSVFIHWTYTASMWQCICSLHCSYTETILPIHSTSVWDNKIHADSKAIEGAFIIYVIQGWVDLRGVCRFFLLSERAMYLLLSPASRSEEGRLLNSPSSVRPSVVPRLTLYSTNCAILNCAYLEKTPLYYQGGGL